MPLPAPLPWRRALLGGSVFALLALAAYVLAAQPVFYKTDGPFLVLNLAEGHCEHPYNVLYMPLLCGLHALLAPLGATPYASAVALSVLGGALGVGLAHVGLLRSGLDARAANAATLLVALTPAIVFFATVVEHHGIFLPFAALAFWITVELARRPSWPGAVLLGVTTHVAYLVHGTGNLLPGLLLPAFLAWRAGAAGRGWIAGRDLAIAALAGALHLALFFGLRDLELPSGGVDAALDSVLGDGIGQPRGLEYLPSVLWHEWLLPFAPLSLAALAGLLRPGLRAETLALGLGLVPYLAICVLLIVGEPEFGAYLLPLALLAARITVLAWPLRAWPLFVFVALLGSGAALRNDSPLAAQQHFAAAARAAAAGRPAVLLVGGPADIGHALAALPELERFVPSVATAAVGREPASLDSLCAAFDAYADAQLGAGKVLLVSAGAREDVAALPAGFSLLQHIEAGYRPRLVDHGFWLIER